ncbi:DMT family transporter [Pelagibacteraceae bacterium]|nr:DMT family transporter [Pelagibacteraceae bacterium]MDC0365946.1 DMT family transporter [Pelagibacteraceae bacterium]|tara:strand:- start:107 stop:973 length:867 start_codon:yes stop_codon:yes gene_type:complete
MKFIYKIPGYILLLFGGFCLSWGGLIVRTFETSDAWNILLLRSFFFFLGVSTFLFINYKKDTIKIIKKSGLPALLGGFTMSFSFVAFVFAMINTSVANVVFIISTQTMFLAILGFFYLKEKVSLISFISIVLAMAGITVMVGDSVSSGSLFGNLIALVIPISFSVLVMIVRKNSNLDMVPAIWYASIFTIIYGLIMAESLNFTNHDIFMGFLLGVPQLTFGFICITIGSRTTQSVTVGLLMLSETLCAPLWVWLFINEIPPLSVFLGGAIIILAVIIKSLERKKAVTT